MLSIRVADILVNNNLASFVPGTHAVSKAFVIKRVPIYFALLKFPAGRKGMVANAAVRMFDGDRSDLARAIIRQEHARYLKRIKEIEITQIEINSNQ